MLKLRCGLRTAFAGLLAGPILFLPIEASAAPASEAELNLYAKISAVNACLSVEAGLPYDKAIFIASSTIAEVLRGQHGGLMANQGTKPFSIEDLRKKSVSATIVGTTQICPKEVPSDVLLEVQKSSGSKSGSK
jgi:hypothetical protein